MAVENVDNVARCPECGKMFDVDDMELCPDGEYRDFACLNFEMNFTEEE